MLWVDDELLPDPNATGPSENAVFLHYIYRQCFQKNVKFILKSSTKLARAWLNSAFFPKSLEVCTSFKLVSDVVRLNEEGPQDNKWNAGPILVREFNQLVSNAQPHCHF